MCGVAAANLVVKYYWDGVVLGEVCRWCQVVVCPSWTSMDGDEWPERGVGI